MPRPASAAWMSLPTPVDPVNATLSMSGSRTSAAPAAPSPGMIGTTPGGSSASWRISARQQRGHRRGLGRLQHRGVAAGERGRELPGRHQQREVPGHDLARPRRAARPRGRRPRRRACPPSPRSGRSGRRRAGRPRRATRGSACRRRWTRRPPARGRAPGSGARSGTGTCRARGRSAPPSRAARRARPRRRARTSPGPANATSATGSSVAGLIDGTRVPSTGSRKSPSMNSP